MITTKKEMDFYIHADRMMNRGTFSKNLKTFICGIIFPDYIMDYLVSLRHCEYWYNTKNFYLTPFSYIFHRIRFYRLGFKLGFSIGLNSVGYGVVLPHYGTIVVGMSNRIGNFAVLHTSICITDNGKVIGDAFYCSTGAKITSKVVIANGVSVGANSVVNKDCLQNNVVIAGAPASVKKESEVWYLRDGIEYAEKVRQVESLKKKYFPQGL